MYSCYCKLKVGVVYNRETEDLVFVPSHLRHEIPQLLWHILCEYITQSNSILVVQGRYKCEKIFYYLSVCLFHFSLNKSWMEAVNEPKACLNKKLL